MHYVILGAGPAGVTAAETLRKQDPTAKVTMIGGEGEPPYSRMAIPYYLEGKIGETGTYLRQADGHYDTHGITYREAWVTSVDTAGKRLVCSDGSEIDYDKLLIATGATPITPPIEGINQPGVHNCWTLADARNIAELAQKGAPVVLVGAGFIGCIILEALAKKGVDLTVVERGDRMVPRMLDGTAGNMLRRWCEEQGIRVITGATVKSIRSQGGDGQAAAASQSQAQGERKPGFFERMFGSGAASEPAPAAAEPAAASESGPLAVALDTGETLPAALVVVAAGVKSNTSFLKGSGIACGQGITVDKFLATSVPDVYAAGDVAEGLDLSTGSYDMLAIQPVAVEHGYIAALNMTGTPTVHRGSLNMNVLDTLGLISSSFGLWQGVGGGDNAQLVDQEGYRYIRLEFDGDRLVGAQCVGMTDHIGMLRGLIQTGLRLGEWKERLRESPERVSEAYVAVSQRAPSYGPTGARVAVPAQASA